jgi:TonB family protein
VLAKTAIARAASRNEGPSESPALRSAPETPKAEPKPDPLASQALAVSSGLGSAATEPPAPSAALPAQLAAVAPTTVVKPQRVRQIASRLGHGRLAINALSEPYRVHVPPALQRTGQNFDATVNICVSPSGNVSSVKFVHSAGALIDPQVMTAISRWRYRPLLDGNQAIPFCYVLRYQFAAR